VERKDSDMNSVTKIAFYDSNTDEFYCGENGFQKLIFSSDVTKAKLYTGNSHDFVESFQYVKTVSQRNIICIDVELTLRPVKIDNHAVSNIVDKKIEKLRSKYDPLNAIAEIEVDNLSEKEYREWKLLRSKLRDLGQTV
jgi:hypothetical protein